MTSLAPIASPVIGGSNWNPARGYPGSTSAWSVTAFWRSSTVREKSPIALPSSRQICFQGKRKAVGLRTEKSPSLELSLGLRLRINAHGRYTSIRSRPASLNRRARNYLRSRPKLQSPPHGLLERPDARRDFPNEMRRAKPPRVTPRNGLFRLGLILRKIARCNGNGKSLSAHLCELLHLRRAKVELPSGTGKWTLKVAEWMLLRIFFPAQQDAISTTRQSRPPSSFAESDCSFCYSS